MEYIYESTDRVESQNLTVYSFVNKLSKNLFVAVIVTYKDDDAVDVCFTGRNKKDIVNRCKALVSWTLHHYSW